VGIKVKQISYTSDIEAVKGAPLKVG